MNKFKFLNFFLVIFTLSCRGEDKMAINFWVQIESNAINLVREINEDFMRQNPQIIINTTFLNVEELRTAVLNTAISGASPHLVYGPNDNIGSFLEVEAIEELNSFFDKDFLSQFRESALSANSLESGLYALPLLEGNHIALVYNKDLVEREPKTFEELIEMAKSIRREDVKNVENNIYGFAYFEREPYWFIGFFNGFGGRVLNDLKEPNLNSPAMREALSFVRELREKHGLGFPGMLYDNVHELFKQGKIAFILNGAWSWKEYKNAGLDIAVIPVPKVKGKRPFFYSATKGISILKNINLHERVALEKYIKFLVSPTNNYKLSAALSQIPTIKEALKYIEKDELLISSRKVLEFTIPMPIVVEWLAISDSLKETLERVTLGQIEIDAAAEKMQRDAVNGILMLKGEQ